MSGMFVIHVFGPGLFLKWESWDLQSTYFISLHFLVVQLNNKYITKLHEFLVAMQREGALCHGAVPKRIQRDLNHSQEATRTYEGHSLTFKSVGVRRE